MFVDLVVVFVFDMVCGMVYFYGGFNVIIYCDFKFWNFIIDEVNELKVGDFGLSKFIKVVNIYEVYKLIGEIGSYWYMVFEVFLC